MKDTFKTHKEKIKKDLIRKIKSAIKNDTYSFILINKTDSKEYVTLVNNCIAEINAEHSEYHIKSTEKVECNEDTRWYSRHVIRVRISVVSANETEFLDTNKQVNW